MEQLLRHRLPPVRMTEMARVLSTAQRSYVALIIANRGAGQKNLATWDIGMGLVAAASMGASTFDWVKGVETTIDTLAYTNADYYWEPIGLAGAVYGLAFVGADYTATAGDYSGLNLAGMANAWPVIR